MIEVTVLTGDEATSKPQERGYQRFCGLVTGLGSGLRRGVMALQHVNFKHFTKN